MAALIGKGFAVSIMMNLEKEDFHPPLQLQQDFGSELIAPVAVMLVGFGAALKTIKAMGEYGCNANCITFIELRCLPSQTRLLAK